MFKIKIQDSFVIGNKFQKPEERYVLLYELVPEHLGGFNIVWHKAMFSTIKKAQKVADSLAEYLTDAFYQAELYYLRLVSLSASHDWEVQELNYSKKLFEAQEFRAKLYQMFGKAFFAYEIILILNKFLNALRMLPIMTHKGHKNESNMLYKSIDNFIDYNRKMYRSAHILTDKNLLKLWSPL